MTISNPNKGISKSASNVICSIISKCELESWPDLLIVINNHINEQSLSFIPGILFLIKMLLEDHEILQKNLNEYINFMVQCSNNLFKILIINNDVIYSNADIIIDQITQIAEIQGNHFEDRKEISTQLILALLSSNSTTEKIIKSNLNFISTIMSIFEHWIVENEPILFPCLLNYLAIGSYEIKLEVVQILINFFSLRIDPKLKSDILSKYLVDLLYRLFNSLTYHDKDFETLDNEDYEGDKNEKNKDMLDEMEDQNEDIIKELNAETPITLRRISALFIDNLSSIIY